MDVTSSLRSLLPYGRRSIGINQLIAKLETYLPPDQVELVQEAYDFAFHAHDAVSYTHLTLPTTERV